MIKLKTSHTLVFNSVDQDDLNHSKIIPQYLTESFWSMVEEKIFQLTYTIFFSAQVQNSTDFLLKVENKLVLQCFIENVDIDAIAIIEMKKTMNNSLGLLLESYNFSYFPALNFRPLPFTNFDLNKEKINMERVFGQSTEIPN